MIDLHFFFFIINLSQKNQENHLNYFLFNFLRTQFENGWKYVISLLRTLPFEGGYIITGRSRTSRAYLLSGRHLWRWKPDDLNTNKNVVNAKWAIENIINHSNSSVLGSTCLSQQDFVITSNQKYLQNTNNNNRKTSIQRIFCIFIKIN